MCPSRHAPTASLDGLHPIGMLCDTPFSKETSAPTNSRDREAKSLASYFFEFTSTSSIDDPFPYIRFLPLWWILCLSRLLSWTIVQVLNDIEIPPGRQLVDWKHADTVLLSQFASTFKCEHRWNALQTNKVEDSCTELSGTCMSLHLR